MSLVSDTLSHSTKRDSPVAIVSSSVSAISTCSSSTRLLGL